MTSETSTRAPEILWAQRSSDEVEEQCLVMLTINVPNLPSTPGATKLDLTSDSLSFESTVPANPSRGQTTPLHYAFKLDFYEPIDPAHSTTHQSDKSLYLVLRKANKKIEFWPRLTKEKIRLHNVKTDFDKWVDEDEQSGELEDVMAGAGGMGGSE